MRSPWGLLVSASVLLLATHGAAAPETSPADPAVLASTIVDDLQAAATAVRHQLQAARAQRDVIKTICLNDKLTQLDVAVRSARQRREALAAAAAQADAALVGQERARIEVHREQGRRVAAEAHQCVGQPEPPSGDDHGGTTMTTPPLPDIVDYPPAVDVFAALSPPSPVSAYK